ncbi:Gfo/Idh/MocA family protein [Aporhodopirellula aestuarii]|uniref:Gfo/Idh/MocA family oxidoreductase n=1 Tax=Aporhodopirellula aestuarii TaxID=2950107 RepID=A0ABT0TZX6_9BACT|nr:Gfo/Idh/MocA family oxidoreductase [Aporhodopirellula aestuarii]MCM2370116.1 Gfo/Idh/MocA family oxidoreductase [Aporhodopirellula aestuarii]
MTQTPVRFGVLGTGRITRRLVADLQSTPGASVTAIASRCVERARWHADSHGIAAAVEGYAALLARDDVDAVYIALPPSMHHEWTLAACSASKHVLCEKPVALNASQVAEMIAAANERNLRFLDATAWLHHERTEQFRRWLTTTGPKEDSVVAAAKKDNLFSDDSDGDENEIPFRLGPLRHLSASVSFPNPFQDGDHRLHANLGGGALLDLGWYSAGLILFASGVLPKQVYAQAVMREGIIARVSATMMFEDNLTATLSCGFDTSTRKWFEIAGEDASIVCDDFTRPWADKPARSWVHEASGKVHSFVPPSEVDANAEPIAAPGKAVALQRCQQEREMIGTLVRWIQEGASAYPDDHDAKCAPWYAFHEQALHTQTLLDALDESIRCSAPVTLG